jgi:hypothetical protein
MGVTNVAILFPVFSAAHRPVVQMTQKFAIEIDSATTPPATKTHGSPDEAHAPAGDVQQTGEHDGQFGSDDGTQGTGKPAPMPNAEANVSDKFSMQKATYEQSKPTPGMPAAGIPVQNRVGRIEFKT